MRIILIQLVLMLTVSGCTTNPKLSLGLEQIDPFNNTPAYSYEEALEKYRLKVKWKWRF